jgi:predicted metalloendopeptidase
MARGASVRLELSAGMANAESAAPAVIDLIQRQRNGSFSSAAPTLNLHEVTYDALAGLLPQMDFDAYFQAIGITPPSSIQITDDAAWSDSGAILEDPAFLDLVRYRVISAAVQQFPQSGDFTTCLQSNHSTRSDSECRAHARQLFADVYSDAFVARTLPDEQKKEAAKLIDRLVTEFGDRLRANTWLDDDTRAEATAKLSAVRRIVGFLSRGLDTDYGDLDQSSYVAMTLGAAGYEQAYQWAHQTDPWLVRHAPASFVVNAYYDADSNAMLMLAGILRAPFWNGTAAASYATIGAVMGHELTHGFDSSGANYDSTGAKRDWWTPATRTELDKRVSCIRKQFSEAYGLLDTSDTYSATNTQAENIADLGGVTLALAAAEQDGVLSSPDTTTYGVDVTPRQGFFLAYAQMWRTPKPDGIDNFDRHAHSRYRVNAPQNLASFAEAFHCSANAPMVRADRCEIW